MHPEESRSGGGQTQTARQPRSQGALQSETAIWDTPPPRAEKQAVSECTSSRLPQKWTNKDTIMRHPLINMACHQLSFLWRTQRRSALDGRRVTSRRTQRTWPILCHVARQGHRGNGPRMQNVDRSANTDECKHLIYNWSVIYTTQPLQLYSFDFTLIYTYWHYRCSPVILLPIHTVDPPQLYSF